MKQMDFIEGGDPITTARLKRAIKRMSFDYHTLERKLAKFYKTQNIIESHLSNFKIGEVMPPKPLGETVQKLKNEDRDYKSRISKFALLKNLFSTADLLHLNEFELTYWHILNSKLLEVGLWSQFKFMQRDDSANLIDLLIMTALKAKKLCNVE